MGKRKKSARQPVKRVTLKLDNAFNCLFCNHEKAITCTLDKKNSIGSLSCKVCGQQFQTRINALSQPVDVYSDWFDAVEEVNEGKASSSEEENSDSDYESDSDASATAPKQASGANEYGDDSDEEEYSEDDRIGNRRGRNPLVESDDE
ncbi:HBL218Cp [Eremothecium sinecaudum]|uniref:Transcription elongation factor 1 homolog n=1 Tax=Eremothecium sinecaudum TaxID=45286 RepID=A0A109UW99_9SACH|nr:HBL218Cp [Eremothecium sinecaudum]AMD18684.1 HBL218Cp [Eremothecium sinecaudum]